MVTTTVLTTSTRPEDEGASMAYFDLLSSTPDSGTVRAGMGLWWVERPGNPDPIKTARGLRFAYATRNNGDIVHARYVDAAGVAGGDASYTFTVTDTWDGEQFCKAAGNNGNAGTSDGAAVQTIVQAITNTRAAWVSGDDRAINLNAGESFATTGAGTSMLWDMSLTGHICIRKYGVGANPIITLAASGNGSVLFGGTMGINAVTLIDVDVSSTYTMGGAVNHSSPMYLTSLSGSAVRASIVWIGGNVSGVGSGWVLPEGASVADRGKLDYFALCDGSLDVYTGGTGSPTTGGYAMFGLSYGRRILIQDWEWLRCDGANGFVRGSAWKEMVVDNVLIDRQSTGTQTNTFRINGGDRTTADDYAHEITLHDVRWRRCSEGCEIEPVAADTDGFKAIELIGCSGDLASGTGSLVKCVETTGNVPFLDDLRVLACWSRHAERVPMVQLNAGATGVIDNVRIAHCIAVGELDGEFFTDNVMLLTQSGAGTADGAITLLNNYGYSLATGAGGSTPVALFQVSATAKINAASDNNKMRKSAGTVNFCNDGGVSRSLASWQGVSAADDQSSVDTGTSNLTSTTAGSFDARPASGTGPQIDFGLAGVLYVDADGNLYTSSTPDAGAFQDGGVAPTEPTFGGGGGDTVAPPAPLTLRLNLRI